MVTPVAGQLPAVAPLSEKDWQEQVVELAQLQGWVWGHNRPARMRDGSWRTPVSGPLGAGMPDLLLCHPARGVSLYVELKTDTGRVALEHRIVHQALRHSGLRVEVWRPKDWTRVVATLTFRPVTEPAHDHS